jgi:hypothetical protein
MLITIKDDSNVDVTFVNCTGLDAEVTFSKDDLILDNLVGKKIFKIQKSMMRMYSENDTSANLDLYHDIETLEDLENVEEHVETRIGNIEPFRTYFLKDQGEKDDYPDRGIYSRATYIDNGVIQNGRDPEKIMIKLDLIKPEYTCFYAGLF